MRFCSHRCATLTERKRISDRPLDLRQDATVHALRQELQRYRKAYQDAVAATDQEQRLLDALAGAVQSFPAVPTSAFVRKPARAPHTRHDQEVPTLCLGDLHAGEVIRREETHGINAYDFNAFLARLEHLEGRVVDILTHHQRGPFPEMHILGLGDYVSGLIHEELEKWGAPHVIDQVYLGGLAVALFLHRIQRQTKIPTIHYTGISGNHGRVRKGKPEAKLYYKNFDYLFNSVIALALKQTPSITITIPRAIFTVREIAGQRILLSHGHEVPPSSLGLPLYSINRASAQYQELLAVAKQGRYDYWILGHTHRPAELDNCIVNGCMSGINEFGIGKAFKPIMPMQKLLGLHSRHGLSWEYKIKLTDAPALPSVYAFDLSVDIPTTLDTFNERIA